MPGISICKPCVMCMGSCVRSSTNESGSYVLKKKDVPKNWKVRPRSSSITVATLRVPNKRKVAGFWKSWESLSKSITVVSSKLQTNIDSASLGNGQSSCHEEEETQGALLGSNSLLRNRLKINESHEATSTVLAECENGWNSLHITRSNGQKNNSMNGSEYEDSEFPMELPRISHSIGENLNLHVTKPPLRIWNELSSSSSSSSSLSEYLEAPSSYNKTERLTASQKSVSENTQASINSKNDIALSSHQLTYDNKNSILQNGTSDHGSEANGNEDSIQYPRIARGAVPKIKKASNTNTENRVPFGRAKQGGGVDDERSIELGKKLHDSKNMTAEVGIYSNTPLSRFNNRGLGKDVLDNGTTLLSTSLSIHAGVLNTEKGRLKTFKNWPNKRIDPKKLAAAGFFYCGKADIVECFVCGIKGHNWEENDKPMDDHMKWNRNCTFVRENTTEHDNSQTRPGRDICGNLGVEIFPNSEPEDNNQPEPNLEKLGIQKTKGPSHPDQIIYETRLATFENWPKSLKQKPAELASAGFYYLGVGDQTLCFYCGGGLKDWVEEDDPWEQHALWFPKCNYLLLKKTPAFVEAVQNKHKGLLLKKEETEVEASCSTSSNTKEPLCAVSEEKGEKKLEESSTLCKICFKNELGVVFLPCGHMVACIECASALKECAVCRRGIQATVRAFLS